MEMGMMMDVDVAPTTGRKRPAASEDAAGLEKKRRRGEEVRGKAPEWNCCEDESRADLSPETRELLHKGHMLRIRSAANLARFMEEFARMFPKSLK